MTSKGTVTPLNSDLTLLITPRETAEGNSGRDMSRLNGAQKEVMRQITWNFWQLIEEIADNITEFRSRTLDGMKREIRMPGRMDELCGRIVAEFSKISTLGSDPNQSSPISVQVTPQVRTQVQPQLYSTTNGAYAIQGIAYMGREFGARGIPNMFLFLSVLLRVSRQVMNAVMKIPVSTWPKNVREKLASRVHFYQAISAQWGEIDVAQVMRFGILKGGLGLVTVKHRPQFVEVGNVCGVLVYLPSALN